MADASLQSQGYPGTATAPAHYWRSLLLFNLYRTATAVLLLAAARVWGDTLQFGSRDMRLFLGAASAYLVFALAMFAWMRLRERFNWQLAAQVGGDIGFTTVMMYASGGLASGLGLLLLTSLAAAGLVSRGRLTLFFAAIATIAVLLEHSYEVLRFSESGGQYVQAGLLSIAYFTTAWLAHTLAKRTVASEQLAAQREIDLANMAQVNQLVIQDMEQGVIVVDGDGVVRQSNSAATRMVGGLSGSGVIRLKDHLPALQDLFERWLRDPALVDGPNLFEIDASLRARFVPVAKRRGAGAVIFLEDLARIRSEARQMKLAALGRLTANIAHEIRNPLGAISHAAELLQEDPAAVAGSARLTMIIRDNVRRLDRMINDVQMLNRGERAERERFRLAPYLQAFVAQFSETERLEGNEIELELVADPHIMFDRDHLNQVLWNLCRNALRHSTRRPGCIRLQVMRASRSNAVRLDVVDDGAGVPAESRVKLFEPFFTTDPGGTGLGLHLAREICEANGAMLEYVEGPGGARFAVTCAAG
ncbi:MAG: HAMP domain-containing histidine kinase [Burkholderiales bacterium]|nr:HAMP domain-containing histidine kinase [Burkholderiales bacterium]